MTQRPNSERRQYPRVDQRLPVKIAANGYDFVTTTQNVSCIGAYCHVNRYIPPFTKILVKLTLPVADTRKKVDTNVECRGVVVRTDDEISGGFNLAIFFNEMKDNQRQRISRYLSQFLSQTPPTF